MMRAYRSLCARPSEPSYPTLTPRSSPLKRNETSFVYDWSVRVVSTSDASAPAVWMCLASETCRTQRVKVLMSAGKTSKATHHLSTAPDIGSDMTASEVGKKWTREEELAILRRSPLFRDDPGRAYVLIETLRIVNNNLTFRIGEYEESLLIRDLMLKEEARVALNAKVIRHAVVEQYDATKRQVQAMFAENRIGSAKCFSIVADFWTASAMNTKFLGLRLYMVDVNSILNQCYWGLGISPTVRGTRRRNTRDGGTDVKWMMTNGLKLNWEWCIPHFTHAATKTAFGLVADNSTSKKTVYQTQHVEVMGTLFSELCSVMTEEDINAKQLLDFRTHRFLGLARVVRRLLLFWDPLVAWYEERATKAQRENLVPPAAFPLMRDILELIQVLSLLERISIINRIGQSESRNQFDALLGLYKLRFSLLDVTVPLKDCPSTRTEKRYFRPEELTNLASSTRALLHKAFFRVFFRWYTERSVMNTCSYAFEMQLLLHPNFKNPDGALKKVIHRSNLQAGASQQVADRHYIKVRRKVIDGVRSIMEAVDTQPTSPGIVAPPPPAVFSEDLMELFTETADEVVPPPADTHNAMHEQRIDEELDRWLTTPTSLRSVRPGELEPVLSFWKRQQDQGNFRLLPLVARVLLSMPSSLSQIERDFGTAGRMVTPQCSSLAPYNVGMATFLNCNRNYVDITQCPELSPNVYRQTSW